MTAHNLKLVPPDPEPQPEELLADLVPQLAAAERKVASIRARIDQARRDLARKRGVAFVRHEHVVREFG